MKQAVSEQRCWRGTASLLDDYCARQLILTYRHDPSCGGTAGRFPLTPLHVLTQHRCGVSVVWAGCCPTGPMAYFARKCYQKTASQTCESQQRQRQ